MLRLIRTAVLFGFCVCIANFAFAAEPATNDEAAVAQVQQLIKQGKVAESIAVANKIQSDTVRYDTMQQIADATRPTPNSAGNVLNGSGKGASAPVGSGGGAAMADFDSLIELVTTTVAPETWEEVGGTGTVAGFPTGVSLDARNRTLKVSASVEQPLILNDGDRSTEVVDSAAPVNATAAGLRSVSLPRLESALLARFAAGLEPTEEMLTLGGLARVDYVAVYPEQGDVVLVGPVADDPAIAADYGLHLSDLAVAMHNAMHGSGKMVCAITPSRENLERTQEYLTRTGKRPLKPGAAGRAKWLKGLREALGKQDVTFEDVEPDSHLALTLLAADYHMKLIGMDIKPGGPVESYLENVTLKADGSPPEMAVLRWWFTLLPTAIETNADKDVFRLPGQLLQVQSENEMLADRGVRQHTGESEPLNREYAARFTKNFPQLAAQYPIYAQLHRSAELIVAASLLRDQKLCQRAAWEPTFLTSNDPYLVPATVVPRQVDTVANHRVLNKKTIIAGISGGVEFQPRTLRDQVKVSNDYALERRHRVGAPAESRHVDRQDGQHWWW